MVSKRRKNSNMSESETKQEFEPHAQKEEEGLVLDIKGSVQTEGAVRIRDETQGDNVVFEKEFENNVEYNDAMKSGIWFMGGYAQAKHDFDLIGEEDGSE